MKISFKPTFIRQYNNLDRQLQEEVIEKIELFRNQANHASLKVHKLQGKLKDCYSFSVTYSVRVVFWYETKDEVVLLTVGTHDIYK